MTSDDFNIDAAQRALNAARAARPGLQQPSTIADALRRSFARVHSATATRDAFMRLHGANVGSLAFEDDALVATVAAGCAGSVPRSFDGVTVRVVESPSAETLAARRRREAAKLREARKLAAGTMDVPDDEDLREVVLEESPPETDALRVFREAVAWWKRTGRGCVRLVIGTKGTGKTSGACHALIRAGESGLFVPAHKVGAKPENAWSGNAELWDLWSTVDVLVIDDFGVEHVESTAFASLLLRRHGAGLLTLATSNLTLALFTNRYLEHDLGERFLERMRLAQGRARMVEGRLRYTSEGLPWCVPVKGESLRSIEAREALRGSR